MSKHFEHSDLLTDKKSDKKIPDLPMDADLFRTADKFIDFKFIKP